MRKFSGQPRDAAGAAADSADRPAPVSGCGPCRCGPPSGSGQLTLIGAGWRDARRSRGEAGAAGGRAHSPEPRGAAAFTGGDVGFAEAYLDGDWDSPDLAALIELRRATRPP